MAVKQSWCVPCVSCFHTARAQNNNSRRQLSGIADAPVAELLAACRCSFLYANIERDNNTILIDTGDGTYSSYATSPLPIPLWAYVDQYDGPAVLAGISIHALLKSCSDPTSSYKLLARWQCCRVDLPTMRCCRASLHYESKQ